MTNGSIEHQRQRYNRESEDYERHHGDRFSQLYRDQFIRKQLFDFDLKGLKVLDAMAASGTETGYLLSRGSDVTGLDISEGNAELYEKNWRRPCLVQSIHDTNLPDESFDVVSIMGGLHHVLPLLDETMQEIHRILRPGGYFCFLEPNKDTLINVFRNLWYKADKRFHETEQAISYAETLKPYLSLGFREILHKFGGGPAYMLIAQSLIVGTPTPIKRALYRPLFILEHLPMMPNLFFFARWQKRP